MTFEETQKPILIGDQRATLKNFKQSKEWDTLKEVVEKYILKLTTDLVTGTETERGSSEIALGMLRGFTYYWKKIKNVIEQEDEDKTIRGEDKAKIS